MIVLDMTRARVQVWFVFGYDPALPEGELPLLGVARAGSEAEARRAAISAWGNQEYRIAPYTDAGKMLLSHGGE